MVAHVLGVPSNAVTIVVRRMGGGFGGKETQPNLFASIAAVAAKKYGRAVKLRPDRDDDMVATGKRHDFLNEYEVGFDDEGRILAVEGSFAARCGFSADLSGPVTDRALFHADNAYYYPDVRFVSKPMKTNTVSNTAFRGFGGPQGLIVAERIMEEIGYALGKDPLEVRKANFYGGEGRDLTPYHQKVTDNIIGRVVEELEASSDYAGAAQGGARLERQGRRDPQGDRADAGEVRDQLHRDLVQPGRRLGACLQRRLDPPEPRRHRDGPGPQHQGGAGGGRLLPGRPRPGEDHRDDDGEGAEHLGDGGLVGVGPERHGGAERGRADQGAADRLRGGEVRGREGPGGVRAELRADRQPAGRLRRLRQGGVPGAGAPVGGRVLQDAGHPLGPGGGQGAAVLLLRLWRGGLRGQRRHADRRVHGRPHRHPARRRAVAEPGGRQGARSRAASSRAWGG